jgi:3-oxoacyl-[acyl-carrier protein] reductase
MKKIALITGASGGIGGAIALRLARDGFYVLVHYNTGAARAAAVAEAINKNGGGAETIRADLSDKKEVDALFAAVLKKHKRLDVLVNNAGVSESILFSDCTYEHIDGMLNINLKAAMYLTKLFVPALIAAGGRAGGNESGGNGESGTSGKAGGTGTGANNTGGKIINITSMWGISGAACEVSYSAAKAGLIGFTKALAKELGPSGVNVNAIACGAIDTPMLSDLDGAAKKSLIDRTYLCRLGAPSDIAGAASFLAGTDSDFITGQTIEVDGGFNI